MYADGRLRLCRRRQTPYNNKSSTKKWGEPRNPSCIKPILGRPEEGESYLYQAWLTRQRRCGTTHRPTCTIYDRLVQLWGLVLPPELSHWLNCLSI